jgi:phosphoribosylformimino-5-aminoimidazole carboxamide ribotide isomerase
VATFDLIPAIDLRGGHVVRLVRGDFGRETSYGDDSVAMATAFVDGGARWLHVVDLDGARAGHPVHGEVIERIVASVGSRASVEVAGGLRTPEAVAGILDHGAARAVVGTAALADPTFASRLVALHGQDRVAVSLDIRDGLAVGAGWVADAEGTPVQEALVRLAAAGVRWIEVTAIDRDGTLSGPDLELLRAVAEWGLITIASGGIASVDDLRAVRALGCAGAIVGRALYDGTLGLGDALAAAVE